MRQPLMKKIRPVSMDRQKFRKTRFSKLLAHFRITGINAWNKTNECSKENSCTSKRVSIAIFMKEINFVFSENIELQHQGKSILIALFGIPSMWGSQTDMYQQNFLRTNFVFFEPGKAGIVKRLIPEKLEKEFKYSHFQ